MPLPSAVESHPDKVSHRMATSGEAVTFRELDERSIRLSRALADAGVGRRDVVAVLLENHVRYPEVYWGVIRLGALLTAVNRYSTADEVAHIVNDSGAKALITSQRYADVAAQLADRMPRCTVPLMMDGVVSGYRSYEELLAEQPREALSDPEPQGDFMNYSSGTTGRPKGIKRAVVDIALSDPSMLERLFGQLMQLTDDTVYLSTAPLYHSAPLAVAMAVQAKGGTVVIMEHFDAEQALHLIERHRVGHSQWVPTMFVRLLKLPEAVRTAYDLSSHQVAIHAAAPCPPDVKRQMIDWWGPIVLEYYGGTEVNGLTFITTDEWLAHPGSVGKPVVGAIHICDDDGNDLPAGSPGLIYFERDSLPFEYHNDPAKTAAATHPMHPTWTCIGDIGHVDEDGYLYLRDRTAFTIISGGVNVYPRETEDVLVLHPHVTDAAVFGVPDPEMGQQVVAAVQLVPRATPSDALAEDIATFCRSHLARFKVPQMIHFMDQLPRLDTGKLYKQQLIEQFTPR